MWVFVIAGAIYLMGVGVILVIRPSFMFTPDGDWKEFGIGQSEDRYTPFPFWLFCLVWALVCYFIVLLSLNAIGFDKNGSSALTANANASASPGSVVRKNGNRKSTPIMVDEGEIVDLNQTQKLPKGYYVLNKKATRLAGVPKYVYLGEEE
uniref:Uncharacterized protein n=1 Tax=viral metagenome TaxID=1070528 RepID=A0A6C0KPI7_9ZZZZ